MRREDCLVQATMLSIHFRYCK